MKYLFNIMFLVSSLVLYAQDCEKLSKNFNDYASALYIVESSNTLHKEVVDSSKSSWIKGLTFYQCNNQTGFLVMETKKKKYIHQNVPISIWKELKKASSLGAFYNKNIKGNYKLNFN